MADLSVLKGITTGGAGVWVLVGMFIVALIRAWPVLKKIQQESDASLRADLLKRITELEKQMIEERRRCEEEIGELRKHVDGLMSLIRQNSQSTAYRLGDPEGTAITKAARKARGEEK